MYFSIIVPVYNAEVFVGDTIENLLRQNVDKEIILVNDGSTDNSLSILRDYELRYECIRVIDKPNGGVASARNAGLDIATGDYVIFVDSDDFIDDNLLSRCEKVLEEINPDVLIFSYKFCFPKTNGVKEVPITYKKTGLYTLKEWIDDYFALENTHIMHCIGTKIYKRIVLEEKAYRFDENTNYCEDIGFCTGYFSLIKNLYFINEPLYHYRMINDNNRISKYKPHLSFSKDYLHKQQAMMFENIYKKDNFPHYIILKIYEKDIEECLCNLFCHSNVSLHEIEDELLHLSSNEYLDACYKQTKSCTSKICLHVLGNYSISKQIHFFRTYFIIVGMYKKYLGQYVQRIYNKLIEFKTKSS